MFKEMPGEIKWVVMGDMLELGKSSEEEHEELANEIKKFGFAKAYLYGPLASKYTYAKLSELGVWAKSFKTHQELLTALNKDISGGESILFKGSQSCQLDAVLEMLLLDKGDAEHLPRREKAWQNRREAMKLHL
jgi:UDP-N-acetylmuramoyl-tripeptide--D-alanyl-D-alanine ligase